MTPYLNKSGYSTITAYRINKESIDIKYINGDVYRYSYDSTGESNVEEMKVLAENGHGLNGFIRSNVYEEYEFIRN